MRVVLASALTYTSTLSLVRPACSTASAYCTQLTALVQMDVDGGIPLAEACRILAQEYQSGQRLFASFGDYDVRHEVAWQGPR